MMMSDITVITPTLPSRRQELLDAMASVDMQTLRPEAHLIGVDLDGRGPGRIRNQLVRAARTNWVAFLDDDDYLDPDHLMLLAADAKGADLCYSWCRFDGPPLPSWYYNQMYSRERLRQHGIFPITVLARKSSILEHGGFRDEDTYEDWSLWNRMADGGCEFHWISEITWTYRTGHVSRTTDAMEGRR